VKLNSSAASLHLCTAVVAALIAVPAVLVAQSPRGAPESRLRPAADELQKTFSVIASVRELADGRVLVSDEKEAVLALADFRTQTVRQIGRQGAGPGEYRQLGRIWALAGDSSLMKEPFAPRWIAFRRDDAVATAGAADPAVRIVGMNRIAGTDTLGHVFWLQVARGVDGRPSMRDSMFVVRLDRHSLKVDTIARAQSEDGWAAGAGVSSRAAPVAARAGGGSATPRAYALALSAPDQIAVFADGWVAVARAAPYRIEWCPANRACRAGPVLQAVQPPMSDREKRAYLVAAATTQSWPPTTEISETSGWPSTVPPFVTPTSRIDASALLPLPDGRLLVERLSTAAAPSRRYDIIDRSGAVVAHLQMELTERIVGVSARFAYVAVIDDDGLQHLRRHPWP